MNSKVIPCILLILSVFTSYAQSVSNDTIIASDYYLKGKALYANAKFDSAQYCFQNASDIYLKYKLWDKYLYAEAERANCLNLNYDFQAAFDVLRNALKLTDKKIDKNKPAYAFALFHIGKVFNNMNNLDSALVYHLNALKIRESYYKSDHKELADSYYFLNKIFFYNYDFEKAMFYNKKAYEIAQKLFPEDDFFNLSIMNDRGLIELYSMNHREAEKIFERTIHLTQNRFGKDHPDNLFPLSYLALLYQDLGDYDKGIELQKEALRLSINNYGENHYYTGSTCQNLGQLYNSKRQHELAIEYAKQAIQILSEIFGENSEDVADNIGNLGIIYTDLKDFDNGFKYLEKALNIYKEIKGEESYDVSRMYQSIGAAYQDSKNYDLALQYLNKALDIKLKISDSTHYGLSQVYSNLGVNYSYMGMYEKALENFNKAIPINLMNYGERNANNGLLFNNIADTYKLKGKYLNSLKLFQKALVMNHRSFSDSLNVKTLPPSFGYYSWHDYSLSLVAKAEIFSNFFKELNIPEKESQLLALNHFMLCDTILTKIKMATASKDDKITIANQMINIYKGIVDCCMKLAEISNNPGEQKRYYDFAFLFSEKNKASVLLEALAGSEAQKFAGIPDSLLQRERNLNIDISYYEKLLAESPSEEEELSYVKKLFKLNREYDSLIIKYEKNYPKYHDLKYAKLNSTVPDIQSLLDKRSALVSWFMTDSYTTIFIIKHNQYKAIKIPYNQGINLDIIRFRANISDAYSLWMANENKDKRIVDEYMVDGYNIYKHLFPNEIQKELKKIKNLILIPDTKIASIPLEALLTENVEKPFPGWDQTGFFSELPYLIKKFNISYSYSANLFSQTSPKSSEKPEFSYLSDWLALAPVFTNDSTSGTNLRTRQLIEKNSSGNPGSVNTRAWLRDGSYIAPLPGSEEETKNIFQLFENNNKKAVLKTHKFANEEFVKSGALKDFRFLHVATHGMVNESKPELSCILLAQDTTSSEDNILFSGEIYNLELNADLVVLSACETGLGKIAEGEGVIGLTRALLYAGCKNIIVSLWQVSDESTSQLMVQFYKNHFNDENKGFADNLTKAKLKLINDGKFAHPFFWSPFILIGK
jgi:CHAT domain-containing protein